MLRIVFREVPSSIPLNVVAAKLHFTDNNLAGSIYLDARSNTKKEIPEKIPMANLEWGLSQYAIHKKTKGTFVHERR